MEKRAAIERQQRVLEEKIAAAAEEQQENIRRATNNRNVFFTKKGECQKYSATAFRELIQEIRRLGEVALSDE